MRSRTFAFQAFSRLRCCTGEQRAIHDDDAGFERLHKTSDLVGLALADERCRTDLVQRNDAGIDDIEIDRARQACDLVKPRLRRTILGNHSYACRVALWAHTQIRTDDNRAAGLRGRTFGAQTIRGYVTPALLQSDFLSSRGRRALLATFKELDRVARHDGRNRVLVDKLRMPIASQQHAEIIEPRDNALQLHSVHEKDRERDFCLTDMIEEGIL